MTRDTFLFDLDGTLLPMNQRAFADKWFEGLAIQFKDEIDDMKALEKHFNGAIHAIIKNDGSMSNEELFWKHFTEAVGEPRELWEPRMEIFYRDKYWNAKEPTWENPVVKHTLAKLKEKGYTIVLATNPVFPPIGTRTRVTWAGVNPDIFDHITTFDNSRYCKPNLKYYEDTLRIIGKKPEQCYMVGNDVGEDMVAEQLGLEGYLITDCLLNRYQLPITCHWQGSFEEFDKLW